MIDLTLFSQRLDDAIKASGMKQIELADKIGVSQQTISSYVRAATTKKQPSLQNLVDIADVLDVSVDWLLGRSVREPQPSEDHISCMTIYKMIEDLINMTSGELTTTKKRIYLDTAGIDGSSDGTLEKAIQVTIRVPELSQFLEHKGTMLALKMNGTIDRQLFTAWEDGALSKLNAEPYKKRDACIPYKEEEFDLPF